MSLLENEEGEKKSIKVPGVQKFSWVENSKILCCISHASTRASIPTKVTLLDVKNYIKIMFFLLNLCLFINNTDFY